MKKKYFILFGIFVLTIAICLSINYTKLLNYYSINGDFQTYNILRRFVSGQFMYTDYVNYLGFNVPLLMGLFVMISNTLYTSMFVSYLISTIIFFITTFTVTYIITKKEIISILSSIVIYFCTGIMIKYFKYSLYYTLAYNSYIIKMPGNSLRIIRGFLPFVILGILYLFLHKKIKKIGDLISIKNTVIIGITTGIMSLWSNDYGVACILSVVTMYCLLLFKNKDKIKDKLIKLLLLLLSTVVGLIIITLIVSKGDISSLIKTTLGIADYQYWYYNDASNKIATFSGIIRNEGLFINIIIASIILIMYLKKYIKNTYNYYDLCIVFILFTNLLASGIYVYGSGGLAYENLSLINILILLSFVYKKYKNKIERSNIGNYLEKVCILLVIICLAITISKTIKYVIVTNEYKEVTFNYSEELGGYIKTKSELDSIKEIVKNEKVFSTYSGAYEAINGYINDTKSDYIIHVLGDDARKEYIKTFNDNNYKYVLDINPNYDSYTPWLKRANWFFYKVLYKKYTPVHKGKIYTLWKKNENDIVLDYDINIKSNEYLGKMYSIRLSSKSDEDIIVDLDIEYKIGRNKSLCALNVFKTSVIINDPIMKKENNTSRGNYYIPSNKNNYNIGVVIKKNSESKISISSYPNRCTYLNIKKIKVNEIYKDYNEYINEL